MKSIYDLTLEQLKEELKAMGQKPFRAKQIYEWIYVKNVYDFHQMTNLSKELQETLSNHFSDALLTIKEKQVARDGTTKYLLEFHHFWHCQSAFYFSCVVHFLFLFFKALR